MLKKADYALIIIITLFALFFNMLFVFYEKKQPSGSFVSISLDGKRLQTIPLNENGEHEFENDGNVNTFLIVDGCVKMTYANCPDGLCMRQKSISKNGETIVCLPHRFVLKTESDSPTGVDSMAY